jgi:hypothetical protein
MAAVYALQAVITYRVARSGRRRPAPAAALAEAHLSGR